MNQDAKAIAAKSQAGVRRQVDFGYIASRWGTVAAALVIFIGFGLGSDRFVSASNLTNVLVQISVLMVVSSGLTVAVASGEFDLSVGQAASLSGVLVAGMLVLSGLSVPLSIAVAMAAGIGIGVVNGLLVTLLRIPSLIATLAMGPITLGINYAYTGGDSIYAQMPDSFYAIAKDTVFGLVPMPIVIAFVVVAFFYVLLNRTRLGRSVIATGANIQAARLSGIKVNRARLSALTFSAAGAALGGVMLTARLGTGQSGAGDAYLMDSLTAVFLGMTAFKPGRATIQGTLVGVVIIGMLDNGLNLLGAPFYLQNMVRGLVMIAAVSLAVLRGEIRFFR
ncbi:ABC transporter permease [Burkholderia aenigmatica]|uniref:ATPase n=1 Tax=Burkholderia aenigmatica TaxID=2015348 RepID=A0A228IN83_9BURK|nr:ABC transporter permease [Burkholderia aenigmatica]OXI43851.1 ATPase [Burkholderia aenigmatica]